MKTPDEIKNGLEYASTTNIARKVMLAKAGRAPYAYTEEVAADALAYIQSLEVRLVEANKTLDDLRAKLAEYEKPLEPMPLQEVFAVSRDEGNIVWLEYRDEAAARCGYNGYYEPQHIMAYTAFGGYKGEVTFYPPGAETEKTPDPAVYGIGWRCWPRKPTDEERKAAKWDE